MPPPQRAHRTGAALAVLAAAVALAACDGADATPTRTPPPTAATSPVPLRPTDTPTPSRRVLAPTPSPIASPTPPPAGSAMYDAAAPYCAAVGTVDLPRSDPRYTGPQPPDDLTAILEAEPAGTYARPDGFARFSAWRCVAGTPYVCFSHGPETCIYARTSDQPTQAIIDFCEQNPDFSAVPLQAIGNSTVYGWSCTAGSPRPTRNSLHVDDRGFIAEDWRPVTPP